MISPTKDESKKQLYECQNKERMEHRTAFRNALEAYIAFSRLQDGTEEAKARAELLFDDADYRGVNFYGTTMRTREDVDAFRDVLADMLDRVKVNDPREAADCVLLALSKVYKYNGMFQMARERSCVQPPSDRCPICLEDLSTEDCCRLTCHHMLHVKCAKASWDHGHFTCPTCRAPILGASLADFSRLTAAQNM